MSEDEIRGLILQQLSSRTVKAVFLSIYTDGMIVLNNSFGVHNKTVSHTGFGKSLAASVAENPLCLSVSDR